ncbi:unnamed protein product [Chondrus crispus]|uniref:Uncharacterized protein n=1 Tax=Chondrus crispus TaxID=2769 RepID=R7QS09_CHOCR|nr:unnamed protein product [Chondrus crispus]CDF41277.1 unnamed protein product [Chondrus crispus]|eukprot:XP_005711571.1 unnamed protein product [Chondrus crispus]
MSSNCCHGPTDVCNENCVSDLVIYGHSCASLCTST